MIHSLQSKLALQSIIWKNSLHQCSLEYPYKGFIWSKISDLRKMKGWLKVMQGQLMVIWFLIRYGMLSKLKLYFIIASSHHIKNYIKWFWISLNLKKKKSRSFTSFIRRVGATISLWRPITVFGSTLKITIAVVIVIAVSLVNLALVQIITARACPWVGIITWKRLCATPGAVRKVSTATICFTNQVK